MKPGMPSTKTDYVYKLLKAEIVSGRLPPGQRLRLTELAGDYAISEMPIREALRMLQRDGLVAIESHRGATVAALSHQDLLDIIATRTHLEILAVAEAVPFHTPRTIAGLRDHLARMAEAAGGARFSERNRAFHLALYEPCRNGFLKAEIDQLWDRVWRRWSHSLFELRPERRQGASQEHEAIVAAIESGSREAVEAAVRRHREETLEGWARAVEMLAARSAS